MSVNSFKEKRTPESEKQEVKVKKKSSIRASRNFIRFMKIFKGVNRNQVVHSMPFILFITVLLIAYISNSYYAEGLIRDINKTKTELKEKRAEYISTKARLMYHSNQSEMAKTLEQFQVKESTHPPERFYIKKEKSND